MATPTFPTPPPLSVRGDARRPCYSWPSPHSLPCPCRPKPSDAALSALALEDNNGAAITLRPTFAATTTEYRAAFKHNVNRVTVTATAAAGVTVDQSYQVSSD